MFLTPAQIRYYLSIASTAVVLSLNTIIPACAEQVSFNRQSQRTTESSLEHRFSNTKNYFFGYSANEISAFENSRNPRWGLDSEY